LILAYENFGREIKKITKKGTLKKDITATLGIKACVLQSKGNGRPGTFISISF